jgi:hypothetical protein
VSQHAVVISGTSPFERYLKRGQFQLTLLYVQMKKSNLILEICELMIIYPRVTLLAAAAQRERENAASASRWEMTNVSRRHQNR